MKEGKIRDTISVLDYYNPHHYEITIEDGLWHDDKYNLSSSYEAKEFVIKALTINLDFLVNGDNWKVSYINRTKF